MKCCEVFVFAQMCLCLDLPRGNPYQDDRILVSHHQRLNDSIDATMDNEEVVCVHMSVGVLLHRVRYHREML